MSHNQTGTVVPTLQLDHHTDGPIAVVRATGELDLDNQDEFEQLVNLLLSSSSVVVDLSRLEFLAISALRSLIVCHSLADSLGREVFYAEPSRQLLRLLAVSGLAAVLPVRASVTETLCTARLRSVDGASVDSGAGWPLGGLPNQPLGDIPQLDVR